MMEHSKIIPTPTIETKPYWDTCQEKKLSVQKCEIAAMYSFIRESCVQNVAVGTYHGWK